MCAVNDEEPLFGKIVDIIVSTIQETLFVLQIYNTLCFNEHYHAYEVAASSSVVVYFVNQLCDYHPLHLTKARNMLNYCVTPKYHYFS